MSHMNQNQKKAILEFCNPANSTVTEVGDAVGVTERTIYRYLADPDFQKELDKKLSTLRREAYTQIKATLTGAVNTLKGLLDSNDERIALRAANSILDFNVKILDAEKLEKRLDAIEQELLGDE